MRPRRPWDDAGYRKRRELVMSKITPSTRCWRCGRTAREHPLHSNGRRGHWQCGHIVDGSNLGPLAAEFSTCKRPQAEKRETRAAGAATAPIGRGTPNHTPHTITAPIRPA